MKSRGDETSKAKTEKSSGEARPSQDKASRRLSERLESLAVEKKPVDEEANGSGAK